MRILIGRLIAVVLFAWSSGFANASLLNFEEVGPLSTSGVHYFDNVGDFKFEIIGCNCPAEFTGHGVGLFNAVDSLNTWDNKLYNTPKNVVYLNHDIEQRMTLTSGGIFDLESMFLGNSHFQSPTLHLKGYLESNLIYDLLVPIPNIPNGVGPGLQEVNVSLLGVDRVEWATSRINIGSMAMDSISYSQTSEPIPLPATLALFSIGLAGVGWSRRKKPK